MIYIFDKTQSIIKVLTNDDFTAAHLNFKINTATTFEFSLPASKALPSGSKYVATPHPLNDSKFIMLRLTERVDNTETIDYSAYELAYQELATDGYIEDKRPAETDAKTLMQIALNGTNWELNNANVAGTAKTNFYYTDHLSAISNVVDLLGGEIVFYIEIQGNAISGRYMDYLARQGADTSKVFASGSNLLTVERQSDTSNIYTAILPRGKGEEIENGETNTPDGYGRRINIADAEWKKSAGKPLDKPKGSIVLSDPDATAEWGQINGNARLLLQTYDDIDDVNVLINSAYKTLQSFNHPQIQYSATVADVGGLSLGDTVLIMHGDRDLSYKTRVFEVKYDLLSPDQTELSLGDDLSSNSITSQINSLNAVADTTSSQTQWTINQIGRPGTTYGETAPDNPKVGDIWFKYLPDGGTEIYRWNGDIWEFLVSPKTADDITNAVDDAVAQAKAHTDEVKQVLSTDIATAKSQAASQASTAEANAKSAATSQFTQAQSALSTAKTDLMNGIASEASARNTAVAAANSQAQTYANQAKADAMSAASSADGVIRTAISSSANSLSATITQNKSSADSGISTAQTIAQAAVDGLKFKVSQTDYDQKTGDLSTKINDVKQTADSSAQIIADIQEADGKQDARMSEIENTASGLKTTISDLQTAQGKQSGDISTLQQRADGFDATVTKVDNLSTGDRNYILDTGNPKTQTSNGKDNQDIYNQALFYSPIKNWGIANGDYVISFDWTLKTALSSDMQASVFFNQSPWQQQNFTVKSGQLTGHVDLKFKLNPGILTATNDVTSLTFRISSQMASGNTITYSSLFMKSGTINTTWTPAPEDLSGATAKAQLTADNATLTINNYKQDADGRINKAQSDITATAEQVATKVSQNDYDIKTGQLTTSVSKAQQTADAATTSLANYKTDADGRISANSADIVTNANAIKQKVAQSDYDANNTKLTSRLTTVETTANGTATTVSNLQQTVNSLGQVNQLFNTEFTPDYQSWTGYDTTFVNDIYTKTYKGSNVVAINSKDTGYHFLWQYVPVIAGTVISFSSYMHYNPTSPDNSTVFFRYQLVFYNDSNTSVGQVFGTANLQSLDWVLQKSENIAVPTGATKVRVTFYSRGAGYAAIAQPMLVFSSTVGTYVQGNYNNNAALAQVKITADSISNFIRDSSGNISSDFQTALSKTSIITGSTLATSIQTQTATQITFALTDNNGKIISLINQDSSGVQIAGKNIVLDGNTTVTGDFYAKGGNFKNLNASNLTVGTLNGSQVNITNINANNIVSGVLNALTANSMTLNAGTINGAAIYVTSMQNQIDGTTQNVRLGINPNWQHQLHIEPVNQSSGWYHYLYAGNDHLFLGAWDGSNSNTYDNRVALFTEGGSSEVDVGTIRICSSGSAIYDDGWGDISGVTSISMKGSDPSYTSMYVGVGNNGTGELRVVTNATIGTSNLNYADARAAHWYTSSLAKYKTNISELEDGSALDMINRAGIYKYQFKTDVTAGNDKYTFGPVIGGDYHNNPAEFLDSMHEGTDDHSASWITMKALQEEDSKVEALIERIEELERKIRKCR